MVGKEERNRSGRLGVRFARHAGPMMLVLVWAAAAAAQAASAGATWQGYTLRQSFAVGVRDTGVTGSGANYDTLVNLQSGTRLLDFDLSMNARNGGKNDWFDSLTLTGFGFGGDPNAVARLQVEKSGIYRFNAQFRRDQYDFAYNLLANPLNPANSNPALAVNYALHTLHYKRNMGDYNLTLFPQSRLSFRLGYSHLREYGPSLTTVGAAAAPGAAEVGVSTPLAQAYSTSTDFYRLGADYVPFARTRISYTEMIEHVKTDAGVLDQYFPYALPGGVPENPGVVLNTTGGSPCASPLLNPATTPPTANPYCQGLTYYAGDQRPRFTLPIEQLTFESGYFTKLALDGLFSYSSGENTVGQEYANWVGLNTRIAARTGNQSGAATAKRVLVDGDLAAVYQPTSNWRISEDASYNSFRIPSNFAFLTANQFAQAVPGDVSLVAPLATFNSSTCPAPYSAAACPQHSSSSPADSANGVVSQYLGQTLFHAALQIGYTFTPKIGAQIGYRNTYRSIYDFAAENYAAEVFDPGGAAGAAAAARGDCALPKGGAFPADLPAGCTLQADGAVVFSGLASGSDTMHTAVVVIHGDAALGNLWVQPLSNLRINAGAELYTADHSFDRITPRRRERYTAQVAYKPFDWARLTGTINDLESSNNVVNVEDQQHSRDFGIAAAVVPNSVISVDLAYDYSDVYIQDLQCFTLSGPTASLYSACPITGSPVGLGALSTYSDKSYFVNGDLTVQPFAALIFRLGYASSFVHGLPQYLNLATGLLAGNFLNPLTPFGPLQFTYQEPFLNTRYTLTRHLAFSVGWSLYSYSTHGNQSPAGLAPIGPQNFRATSAIFAIRYTL